MFGHEIIKQIKENSENPDSFLLPEIPDDLILPISIVSSRTDLKPFKPSANDPESGIKKVLKNEGWSIFSSGKHRLWFHNRIPQPHHPKQDSSLSSINPTHEIYWLMQNESSNMIANWHPLSWAFIANDHRFTSGVDLFFDKKQNNNPNLRVYHLLGFAEDYHKMQAQEYIDKSSRVNKPISIAMWGSQSQARGHIHSVEAVSPEHFTSYVSVSELNGDSQKRILPYMTNGAGRQTTILLSDKLTDFGQKYNYIQSIGKVSSTKEPYQLTQTVYGFESWQSALTASLNLQKELAECWLRYAAFVGTLPVYVGGEIITYLQQACVPSFTLYRPNEADRKLMNLHNRHKWIVIPFAVPLPQSMFTNGVYLDRYGTFSK